MVGNGTTNLVDVPQEKKSIGSKWTFKRKYNTNGFISSYKEILADNRYRQREGIS